jgi:hypothetical protein
MTMQTSIRPIGGFLVSVSAFALASNAFSQTTGPDIWMKMYDGKALTGWHGKEANWKVDTGAIVTASGATSQNTFLVSDSSFADFHFKVDCRLPPTTNNSGLIYRGKITNQANYVMSGYQYEISGGGTGAFYHEQGNEIGFTRIGGCWNGSIANFTKLEIIADGGHVTHLVGGSKCFDKPDMKVTTKGQFGLQLHAPGNFTVNFKNIFIKPLNNSFQVPADNAWDGNGNKIGVLGIDIKPKRVAAAKTLGMPDAMTAWDMQGRKVTASARRLPTLMLVH